MKSIINPAMVELRDAITEAETLTAKAEVSKRDELRLNVLLAKIAALRTGNVAVDDSSKRWLRSFFAGKEVAELRAGPNDLAAGKQTVTYTQGPEGGYLVPQEFQKEIIYGMAQYDPLTGCDLVTRITSDSILRLRPLTVPGWDLSTYKALRVAQTSQQNPQTPPTVSKLLLGGANAATYRASLDGSFEFEEDAFEAGIDLASTAFGIGMARGVGIDLVTGAGTTGIPQGILTGATDSGVTTANNNKLVLDDFTDIYFSVNYVYRQSKKCAWVMGDDTYQAARQAIDTNGRPLINIVGDKEVILGKPIVVCPSMPAFSAGNQIIVFGDLAHYVVYTSNIRIARNTQAAGYVEYGKALYTAMMRVDAGVSDPTGGTTPPLVYATLET